MTEDNEFSTELSQPVPRRTDATVAFRLVVTSGPEASRGVTIDGASPTRSLIGHSLACQLVLSDRQVSRRHAAVDIVGDRLQLVDLESRNGTLVNGVAVGAAYLDGGEHIRVGTTDLRVERVTTDATSLTNAVSFGRVLGASTAMRRLYPLCDCLAASAIPMLIEGETGTGKELMAEAVHERGPRRAAPFIVLDIAAVHPDHVEAALLDTASGAFAQAQGGTLFIDEIADVDLRTQAKLLRVIEHGARTDVRVIAATRRDLEREIQEGRFRDDLFLLLAAGRLELPPLRTRREDVPLLAEHFWSRLVGRREPAPADIVEGNLRYTWPGNVRELVNVVSRRFATGDVVELVDPHATPPRLDDLAEKVIDLPLTQARERIVHAFERTYVARVLAKFGGNVSRAAEASGIARRYFQVLRARQRKP